MVKVTRSTVAEVFSDLPDLPEWARELIPRNGIFGIKSAARDVLQGRDPGNGWWVSYGAGAEISGGGRATPNQHCAALGVTAWWLSFAPGLEEHYRSHYPWEETLRSKILRWLTWMEGDDPSVGAEAGLMGKTYKPAEWRGGNYENLFIGALTMIHLAALRDEDEAIASRTHRLLRQHAAVSRLLEVPGIWPPRSLSLGARTGIPDPDSQACGACLLAGLPLDEWDQLHGQALRKSMATERLLGLEILRRSMDAGWIELRRPETLPELVAEIVACKLRLPWALHWIADRGVAWWVAWLGDSWPHGAEAKGGLLSRVWARGDSYGVGEIDSTEGLDWHLEIGPSGLTIHRRPDGVAIPPPVESEPQPEPTPPPAPRKMIPRYAVRSWLIKRSNERHGEALAELVWQAQRLADGEPEAEARAVRAVEELRRTIS